MAYDPSKDPHSGRWLTLTEAERLDQVVRAHRRLHLHLPNVRLHAALHVVVENQLAEEYKATVAALERLTGEGVSRHDAIHAIASVVVEQMHDLMQPGGAQVDLAAYDQALQALTADRWRKAND
jgi:hypothetical protein